MSRTKPTAEDAVARMLRWARAEPRVVFLRVLDDDERARAGALLLELAAQLEANPEKLGRALEELKAGEERYRI